MTIADKLRRGVLTCVIWVLAYAMCAILYVLMTIKVVHLECENKWRRREKREKTYRGI